MTVADDEAFVGDVRVGEEAFPMAAQPVLDDLSSLTASELLAGYARTLAELRRRCVVRSGNAPVGDYAEWLFANALGGRLMGKAEKSYDVLLPKNVRLQVKSRLVSAEPHPGQLQTSSFRSWEFEVAGFVLLSSDDYKVRRGALVPMDVVKDLAKFSSHVNGASIQMNTALLGHSQATDVTKLLQRAARD